VPELDAELVFEPDEWRAAFILNKKPLPKKMPTLNQVIRLIAQRQNAMAGPAGDCHLCRRCPLRQRIQRSRDLCVMGCI